MGTSVGRTTIDAHRPGRVAARGVAEMRAPGLHPDRANGMEKIPLPGATNRPPVAFMS